jgi:hypothetical protein
MDGVKARWQWLKTQMEPLPAHWPEAQRRQWQHIDHTITTSTRHWLLLDCATLCPHDFDEPAFTAFCRPSAINACNGTAAPRACPRRCRPAAIARSPAGLVEPLGHGTHRTGGARQL